MMSGIFGFFGASPTATLEAAITKMTDTGVVGPIAAIGADVFNYMLGPDIMCHNTICKPAFVDANTLGFGAAAAGVGLLGLDFYIPARVSDGGAAQPRTPRGPPRDSGSPPLVKPPACTHTPRGPTLAGATDGRAHRRLHDGARRLPVHDELLDVRASPRPR